MADSSDSGHSPDVEPASADRRGFLKAAGLAGIPVAFSRNLGRDLAEAALFLYITESEGLGSAAQLMNTGSTEYRASAPVSL